MPQLIQFRLGFLPFRQCGGQLRAQVGLVRFAGQLLTRLSQLCLGSSQFAAEPGRFDRGFRERHKLAAQLLQLDVSTLLVRFEPFQLRLQLLVLLELHFQPLFAVLFGQLRLAQAVVGLDQFGLQGVELFFAGGRTLGSLAFGLGALGQVLLLFHQAAARFGQLPATIGQLAAALLALADGLLDAFHQRLVTLAKLVERAPQRRL
jgi:hypothetical protein